MGRISKIIASIAIFSFVIAPVGCNSVENTNEKERALIAYRQFLNGDIGFDNGFETIYINDHFFQYAFFDMNNDGIPELLLGAFGADFILTYKDDGLVLWWTNQSWSGMSFILENGDVLHRHGSAAPFHLSYVYLILDENGNENRRITFGRGMSDDKYGIFDVFVFESEENLSEEEWKQRTERYFAVNEAEIEWIYINPYNLWEES